MKRGIAYGAAWALVLGLLLSSCGGREKEPEAPDPPAAPATALEAAAGLDGEKTLLTVDGREVPAWRYLYWLASACDRLAQRYREEGLPLDWSAPAGEGTLADYAKEQAKADTALYAVVENWAGAHLRPGAGAPESAPDGARLPDLGLSEAQRRELAAVSGQYQALWALCQAGGSALSPTEEELAAYGREKGALTLDRILVRAGEDRSAAGERAAALFSQLNGAADQAAVFRELAAAGDDPQGPRTCLPEEGVLDEVLLAAAAELEEGQCSGILESEEGFSILRRLPLDTGALLESWFDSSLEQAAREARITLSEDYEALDAAAFYDAFQRARQGNTRT